MSHVEQVRALISDPKWKSMDVTQRYNALEQIADELDYYVVSYCPAKDKTGAWHTEEYPCVDEALDRAAAIYSGAVQVYAGSYVEVIDGCGNSYFSAYAI